MRVGVTHASFGREIQSGIAQAVRLIGFFPLASSPKPQKPEGEQARHLVETVGGGHGSPVERVGPELRDLARGGHASLHAGYLPVPETRCRALPLKAKVLMVGRRSGFV
jgi:hypothetical protein